MCMRVQLPSRILFINLSAWYRLYVSLPYQKNVEGECHRVTVCVVMRDVYFAPHHVPFSHRSSN